MRPGTLVRNSDSWRLATLIDLTDTNQAIVRFDDYVAVWPISYTQPITPADLDRALMHLYRSDRAAYEDFLDTMLGSPSSQNGERHERSTC